VKKLIDRIDALILTGWTTTGILATTSTTQPVISGVTTGVGATATIVNAGYHWNTKRGDV
jgi:hypothetical protein